MMIGLVAEGTHDELLVGPIVKAEIKKLLDLDVTLKLLAPAVDETGRAAAGGWKEVVLWCQNHSGENIATHFVPIFEGDEACDLIIVHADGDGLDGVCKSTKAVESPKLPIAVGARVEHIIAALREHLAQEGQFVDRLGFAIPVRTTESWILASEADVYAVEDIDAKVEFRRAYSRERFGKIANFYKIRGEEAGKNIDRIARQCESYKRFQRDIGELCRKLGRSASAPEGE